MPVCPRPRVTVSSDVAASQGLRVLPRPLPRHVHASGSCRWDLRVNDAMLSAPAEVGTSTRSSASRCSRWLEEEESGAQGDVRATRGALLSGRWGAAARSRQGTAVSGLCFEKVRAALAPGARGQRGGGSGLGGRPCAQQLLLLRLYERKRGPAFPGRCSSRRRLKQVRNNPRGIFGHRAPPPGLGPLV